MAVIAAHLAAVGHMQLAATMTTAQQPGQQQLTASHRPFDRGTAFAIRIIGNHAVVLLKLVPRDVALMLLLEQNIPFGHGAAQATSHTLTTVLDAHLARRPPEGIRPGIDRVGQNVVHGVVCRQFPNDSTPLSIVGFDRQYNAFLTQPNMNLTNTLEFSKLGRRALTGCGKTPGRPQYLAVTATQDMLPMVLNLPFSAACNAS